MSVHGSVHSLNVYLKPLNKNELRHEKSPNTKASGSSLHHMSDCSRNYLTLCLCLSFFSLGLANSLLGPTFVHMTYLLDTDISTLALAHTFGNTAYLLGAVLCGFVFDHLNAELQFTIATFATGLASAWCPWTPNVYGFFAAFSIQHFCMAYIDASGQSYVISLWTGHRFKEPMMQAAHGIWSVGATICPFIILPFLSDLPDTKHKEQTNSTFLNKDVVEDNTLNISSSTESNEFTSPTDATVTYNDLVNIRYSYGVIGAMIVVLSFCFLGGFCLLGPSFYKKVQATKSDGKDSRNERHNMPSYIAMLALLFGFYAAYIWYEMIPGGLLSTFVIKGLDWDVENGPMITSIYWGFHGLGRIIAIPVSMFVSPATMVTWNLTFTTIAFGLMLFVPVAPDFLLWMSVALGGFSMSSTFPSMVLWTSNYIAVTGVVGAVLLVGGSFGGMIGGALAGYLFEQYSHMWVVYLSFIACITDVIIYIALNILVKFSYSKRGNNITTGINTSPAEESELQPMTNENRC